MIDLVLTDSQLVPDKAQQGIDERVLELVARAVELLNSEVQAGRITCCSFFGKRRDSCLPDLVRTHSEEVRGIGQNGTRRIVSKQFYTTSHYVGQACLHIDSESIRIRIQPRFVPPVWHHLLQCASRVYLPDRFMSSGLSRDGETEWLLLLMWRHAFERAMRKAFIPKAYVSIRKNLRFFRGKLDVMRHLKANLSDQSRVFCAYTPLSFDNTINRVIRSVYRILATSNLPAKVCASISEHDNRLASLGVANQGVTAQDIASIKYSHANEAYRPVMELSKVILQGCGAGEFGGEGNGPSYFVDVAEIWENYLLSVMRRWIPEYTFVSPNDENDGTWLLKNARMLRPDFLVYDRGHRLIAVMDAKYKRYERIGRYAVEANSVSREDLYQMATYMFRFGNTSSPLAGIFISPYLVSDEDCLEVMGVSGQFMSVCNLPLEYLNDGLESVREYNGTAKTMLEKKLSEIEQDFAKRLKRHLDSVELSY